MWLVSDDPLTKRAEFQREAVIVIVVCGLSQQFPFSRTDLLIDRRTWYLSLRLLQFIVLFSFSAVASVLKADLPVPLVWDVRV